MFPAPVLPDPSLLPPGLRPTVLSESPLIYTIDNFLSLVSNLHLSSTVFVLIDTAPP